MFVWLRFMLFSLRFLSYSLKSLVSRSQNMWHRRYQRHRAGYMYVFLALGGIGGDWNGRST